MSETELSISSPSPARPPLVFTAALGQRGIQEEDHNEEGPWAGHVEHKMVLQSR